MSDFVSVPLRRSLVAGFVFFAMVMSLGQALAGDSSSQSGSVGATVPAAAPVISNFDMKDTSGSPATIIGTQIVVLTTYTFNFRVNAPNGWTDVTHVYARVWHDGGNDATAYTGQTTGANYRARLGATYTSVTFTGPWTATANIAPGGNSNTNAVTITRISNFEFQLYAYFSTDLIKTTDATKTIPVNGNVKIRQTGDMGGDGTFTGTGIGNKVYVLGSATPTYHTMDASADSGSVDVTFNIAVPLGTSAGTYQGTVFFTVQQQTPLP